MSDYRMKSVEFRKEREKDWQELERLISEAEKHGLQNMSASDLASLPVHYRAALSSLSVARSISLDANLLLYLENLANRAFIRVYGVRHRLGEVFLLFLNRRFPAEVRRFRWLMLLSAAIFLLGGVSGFVQVMQDPDNYYHLVHTSMAQGRDPSTTTEELRGFLYDEDATAWGGLTHFASFLFTHNSQVGILCFALGFALGLPVFYLMFVNGQILGAMSALYHQHGLLVEFWAWVFPHGVTELAAIIFCGGAGLALGRAMIFPGRTTRLASLAAQGRRAGLIVLGCIGMLAVAALIEGLFRQLVHSLILRFLVVGVTAVLWTWYFTRVGRKEEA
jgi:uncharacterized membrane protein SpoIIM required for sporulation